MAQLEQQLEAAAAALAGSTAEATQQAAAAAALQQELEALQAQVSGWGCWSITAPFFGDTHSFGAPYQGNDVPLGWI